ncbi:MarR family winged helix-turn-helix transcriptional regulator, partial [Streptomyces sp. NPDC004166]
LGRGSSSDSAPLIEAPPSASARLIAAGLADRQTNPDNRRETLLRLTDEGRKAVDDVTARRRAEIAAIVAQLAPGQRAALIEALTVFNEAGGEPPVPGAADAEPHPLGWADPSPAHDA